MKINKKKIACLALASALLLPGAIGLVGCEKGHTHAFNSDPYYEVVTEGENKIARSWKKCSCGAEDAHKELTNYKVVSSTLEAQNLLDGNVEGLSNISDLTIVLDEGTYGNLEIRPTRATATVYSYVTGEDTFNEANIIDLSTTTLNNTGLYHYYRAINNLKIVGTENSTITGLIAMESRYLNSRTQAPYPNEIGLSDTKVRHDYVRDIDCNTTVVSGQSDIGFYAHLDLSNLSFERLNFTGKSGRIYYKNNITNLGLDNVTVKSCTFETEQYLNFGAIYLYSQGKAVKNVVVQNNSIKGHFQGIYLQYVENASCRNNTISQTKHNAIAIQNINENTFRGNILIEGNNISKVIGSVTDLNSTDNEVWIQDGQRAIRLGGGDGTLNGANSKITITNNVFNYCYNEIVASSAISNYDINIYNNYYNLTRLEDSNGEKTSIIIYANKPAE